MSDSGVSSPGLYVHIPFCLTRCGYCDFYSCTDTGLAGDFLKALTAEMELWRGVFNPFGTVYIGGGTPSLLSPGQVAGILDAARKSFIILPGAEITVEANPADWGRGELAAVRDLGVGRISLGIQSFDDRELEFLGRRHDAGQARAALAAALDAGFGSVGVDLIYGLPGQAFASWQASLEQALSFRPGHLSCYELELKHDTPLGLRYGRGELVARSEEGLREFFQGTSELAEGAGYVHYEVSNFASGPGLISLHNSKYWDHTPYLGLGPSAHSFKNARRWWNHGTLREYLESLHAGRMPVKGFEDLDRGQLAFEALFLGLRMKQGIDLAWYEEEYGVDLVREKGPQITAWQSAGLVVLEQGRLRPTRAGMAVADALAAD
jgi:oxygen-independent coproporphyrinogen III oxidase